MGKVKGKHRLDKFYRLAKEHGYRSRASWKLIQLDARYSFLRSSHAVLDLCAAPGGWMQVAVQRVPVGSLVLGIDLVPIAPIRGAQAIEQDITKSECKSKIKGVLDKHGARAFDLVLHDGSPNVGGAWAQEAMSQNALVIDSVRLATQFLAPKGNFITKVFRSQDYSSVLYCLKQLFEKVEVYKPQASRSASAETYLLGLKYKAPAKIDPRLLDYRHLFQGSLEPQKKVVDVLRGTIKQKRHRDGYEDGDTTLRKVSSAAEFIWSDTPLEVLGYVTCITFDDPASLPIKNHESTTNEVKHLCDDLLVLGKQDFKDLIKWRLKIRKALSPLEKAKDAEKESEEEATPATAKDAEKETEEDDDDKLLNEMEELTYAMEQKKKRAKKLLAKRQAKTKLQKSRGIEIDVLEDGYVDHELFSLSDIKGKKDLAAVDNSEFDGANNDVADSENEEHGYGTSEDSASDVDSDEERKKYDEQLEDVLDQAYERYVTKKEGSTKQRKRAKQVYTDIEDDGEGEVEGDDGGMKYEYDSDRDQTNDEANPLMVPLDEREVQTQEEITNKWFSQDIFAEAVEEGDLEKADEEDEVPVQIQEKKPAGPKKTKDKVVTAAKLPEQTQTRASKMEEDFEIVPAPETDSSSDDSDTDIEDNVEAKAEILAYAKKMLRKKQRETMLDDAYNKYMFDDAGLPKWFIDEEKKHRQPIKPITKEEINAIKAQFKDIDARPAKKVAEAKARKKRSAMRKLEKIRKKANTISEQADVNERSKNKMIDQLYKKATPKRPKKEYVVAKKGVQVRGGKGKVVVDRRMKSDNRKHGMGKPGRAGKKDRQAKAKKGRTPTKGSASKGKTGNRGK